MRITSCQTFSNSRLDEFLPSVGFIVKPKNDACSYLDLHKHFTVPRPLGTSNQKAPK